VSAPAQAPPETAPLFFLGKVELGFIHERLHEEETVFRLCFFRLPFFRRAL
jgi:hypothetical protein